MKSKYPIILVEDDLDDCELIQDAFKEAKINNPLICFHSGDTALAYLKNNVETIFIIISDINMPVMNGLELKRSINDDEELNNKNIPFIFLSTSASATIVKQAHKLCAQGYFKKPDTLAGLVSISKSISNYWENNILPNVG